MIVVRDRVRFVETDTMGVVHHSNYLRWFEMGRVEYMRQAGVLLNDLMAQDIVFPITSVECQYKSPAKFDDVISIETTLAVMTRAKMIFTYEIYCEAERRLLATGRTQNVFTNKKDNRIIRLPDPYFKSLASTVE